MFFFGANNKKAYREQESHESNIFFRLLNSSGNTMLYVIFGILKISWFFHLFQRIEPDLMKCFYSASKSIQFFGK